MWSEPEPNLPNNYNSALSQLYSTEQRFQRDQNLKSLSQQSRDTDLEREFTEVLGASEVKGNIGRNGICHIIQY